jgi:hypothetical protein
VLGRKKNECVRAYLNVPNRDSYTTALQVVWEHLNQEIKLNSENSGEQIGKR